MKSAAAQTENIVQEPEPVVLQTALVNPWILHRWFLANHLPAKILNLFVTRFEIAAGWESQDADNYETAWERINIGLNWFFNRHKAKVQLTWTRRSCRRSSHSDRRAEIPVKS